MNNWTEPILWYHINSGLQLLLVIVPISAICWLLRRQSAHIRYALWMVVLVKTPLPAMIPVDIKPSEFSASTQNLSTVNLDTMTIVPTASSVPDPSVQVDTAWMDYLTRLDVSQWLLLVWLLGMSSYLGMAIFKIVRTERWLRFHRTPPQPEHLRRLNEQALQFGLKRYTVFWQIDLLTQPFVWGWLRGQLYLPTKSNVDPIVVNHELAHVSRWDAGLNLMQLLVQAVFWFNPVVWWLNSRIRIEREKCCDEIAIARSRITAKQYCLAVVNTIEKSIRPAPETCILSSVGSTKQLEERIKSMLHAKHIFSNKLSPVSVCLVSLIALTSLTASLRLKASEQKPASPSIPSIWPTQARVAQPYGLGVHPVLKTEYFHRGIDIINRAGLPVLATADGKIILADHKGIQGHTVDIDHGNNITTRYCHLENLMVRVGQTVQRGDQIGTVGNTGVDTSPSHLHYEIITQGRPQNPMDYLSLHNRPANIPTIWPTHARITSPFGRRVNPYTQAHERHRGIDIANQTGEPVVATAAGSVTLAADEGTMGLVVEIDHGNGFTTRYCHLGNLEVKTGQTVQPGQIIGRIGMSGKSTGPHVHYEVLLHGQYQDPINYIQQ